MATVTVMEAVVVRATDLGEGASTVAHNRCARHAFPTTSR